MSRTFRLEKLVRDGVVPAMESEGQEVVSRTLTEEERPTQLGRKFAEEWGEADLADLLEVIETEAKKQGKTFDEIREEQLAKRAKIGSFSTWTYVETVTLKDDDPWVEYYAAEPDRFPEV